MVQARGRPDRHCLGVRVIQVRPRWCDTRCLRLTVFGAVIDFSAPATPVAPSAAVANAMKAAPMGGWASGVGEPSAFVHSRDSSLAGALGDMVPAPPVLVTPPQSHPPVTVTAAVNAPAVKVAAAEHDHGDEEMPLEASEETLAPATEDMGDEDVAMEELLSTGSWDVGGVMQDYTIGPDGELVPEDDIPLIVITWPCHLLVCKHCRKGMNAGSAVKHIYDCRSKPEGDSGRISTALVARLAELYPLVHSETFTMDRIPERTKLPQLATGKAYACTAPVCRFAHLKRDKVKAHVKRCIGTAAISEVKTSIVFVQNKRSLWFVSGDDPIWETRITVEEAPAVEEGERPAHSLLNHLDALKKLDDDTVALDGHLLSPFLAKTGLHVFKRLTFRIQRPTGGRITCALRTPELNVRAPCTPRGITCTRLAHPGAQCARTLHSPGLDMRAPCTSRILMCEQHRERCTLRALLGRCMPPLGMCARALARLTHDCARPKCTYVCIAPASLEVNRSQSCAYAS